MLMFPDFVYYRYMQPNRRVVVAMIYWEQMASTLNDQEWHDEQIELAIGDGFPSDRNDISKSNEALPNRQSWALRTLVCMQTDYKQAALNVMVVGNVVGELVKYVKNDFAPDLSYTTFCIGLSLGAHTCGFVGKSSKMVIDYFRRINFNY